MSSNQVEQGALPVLTLGPDLREARRDHTDGSNTGLKGGRHRLEHSCCGNTYDCQVDRVGNVGDRAVATNPCDGFTVAIDRVGGADELTREDVSEELAADRAPASRCAYDGDRVRIEERPERSDDGGVVAPLDE